MPSRSIRSDFWERLSQVFERRAAALTALFVALAIAGGFFSFQLYKNLRTDLEELLAASAPSVQDLKAGQHRIAGTNHLEVVIESSDAKAGERFQRDVTDRLRRLPSDVVGQVKDNVTDERKFFNRYRAYYVDITDLEDILAKAKAKLKSETKKAFSLGLDDDDKEESSKRLGINTRRLREKYDSKSGTLDRFPDDYFQMNHGTTRVVLAFLPGKATDVDGNKRLSKAAEKIIDELGPATYAPDMKVGLGGDVQNVVEENRELVKDLVKSFLMCTVLITMVVWLFFSTLSCVSALSFTLFVGVCLTFGLSYFLVGYLNANTAFLGSIVIGNGINFPIMLLARYAETRRQPDNPGAAGAMALAMRETWKPTLAAAGAAGVSYGSLAFTDFRGFSQFGVIGAVGMTMCWLSTYFVLPPAVLLLERRGWMRVRTKEREGRGPMGFLAPLAVNAHGWLAVGTLVLSLAAMVGASGISKRTIESDLSKLRNKWSMEHGSGFWGKKTDDIFGRGLTPTVVLTDNAPDAAKVYAKLEAIQAREGPNSPFGSLSNIDDVFPPDQKRKYEILNELDRLLTPKVRASLGKQEARLVRDFLPDPVPPPFRAQDLPGVLLKGYEETDGRTGTVIQVYPRLNPAGAGEVAHGTWNGDEVIRYTTLLREAIRESGVHAVILGQNPISADMLESIQRDGPTATLFSFLAVALLVVILFPHWRQAGPVLVSLLLGVLWMVGAIGFFHWKINFLNFIALPITFGIGVDYSVNIFGRIFAEEQRGQAVDLVRVIRETGSAVMLASGTTCIGYGSLLVSGSQAFVSFGKLAVTGEITCISAALLSLPSLWLVMHKRRGAVRE